MAAERPPRSTAVTQAAAGRVVRIAAILVVATVMACSGSPTATDGPAEPAPPPTGSVGSAGDDPPESPVDHGGSAAPTTAAGDVGPSPAPPQRSPTPAPTDPAGTVPTSAPTPVAQPPGSVPVGQLAPFVLRAESGSRLVVEVRAQPGAEPAAATLQRVAAVLGQVSGKQVVLDGPTVLGPGPARWSPEDLRRAADGAATSEQGGGQAVLRLLFVGGELADRPSVLGAAVRGDVAAVFSERIRAAAGLLVAPSVIEEAVTVHEVGHLLGLVDLFLPTGRADPDHPGHSPNRRSVMYWQVESDTITALLGGGIPRDFDADDLADLAAIRDG